MATQIDWTKGMVQSVTLALRTTLDRVTRDSIADTAIVGSWDLMHDWLDKAELLVTQPDFERHSTGMPPFPLSRQQLEALEASVDHIAQAHADVAHVHASLIRLHWTSYLLAAILLASFAVNAVNILIFHGANERAIAQANTVFIGIGLLAWAAHNWRLLKHKEVVHRLHPSANAA